MIIIYKEDKLFKILDAVLNQLKSCPNSIQELLCFKGKTFIHRNQSCNFVS